MSAWTPLFVDLELGRDGRFFALGARRDGVEHRWTRAGRALTELAALAQPGDVLVGHNLHRYDRPWLAARSPGSPLLALPTLDTLELSVLGFPERPYHRLVKNDRLVRDALPDPLADCRASEQVLRDALARLAALPPHQRELLAGLLARVDVEPTVAAGYRHLLDRLGWEPADVDLAAAWEGRVCQHSPRLSADRITMPLVMLSAWLRVTPGSGSVLPAWVRRTWPETSALARDLRATRCDDPDCSWCTRALCPERWLDEVFGFPSFRPEPATDGASLQRVLVDRGLQGLPTFGILPTGGGKSLCFQVPAEARHRLLGQLTVVISPLQSLMKDQVDNLKRRIPHARAIYSGLPALLRPQIAEEVRSGQCGLLYLAPEQFRNAGILRLMGQREIGALVFDEAHCLSQWGHDFRTDYPYVLQAVAELTADQGVPVPPVFLFTATSQADATEQIRAHVTERTGSPVALYDGGSARTNLHYTVRQVPRPDRIDAVVELLGEHLGEGTAIVFCGSRARTEETAEALTDAGFDTRAYHAGLDADERRDLQDAFLAGAYRVIAATNAFGMGVDKPDVRLVVHLDMTSSLEAYLQEAGRAGRDGEPATAVLLWAPGDAEARFSLGATGDLSQDDLRALWRAIRQLPATRRRGQERRTVTARELLFAEPMAGRFDPYDAREETRIKAGVNWLERAAVLERRENLTHVFSGRPRHPSLREAFAEVDALELAPPRQRQWKVVLERLYEAGDEGLSADDLAVLCKEMSQEDPLEGGLRVLAILQQMVERRLVTAGQTFTAFVARGVRESSERRLARWREREALVIEAMEAADMGRVGPVYLRPLAERLTSAESACTPLEVAQLLGTWTAAAQGQARTADVPRFTLRRGDVGRLALGVDLAELRTWVSTRADVARRALQTMLERAEGRGRQVLVAGELEQVVADVEQDLVLGRRLQSATEAVRAAVGWMHDLRIITVQNGLAVFRSAMNLDRAEDAPSRLQGEEARRAMEVLAEHQAHRVLRVHVVDRWAQLMLEDPEAGERLRADWFALPVEEFTARWFAGRSTEIARPTTPQSYQAIVSDLNDRVQETIVTRDVRKNHLVLAGPGSGKTRILVHRVAWLLRCQRVRARQILVVCYTRANAIELRRRLVELVGADARGVSIKTLHAVALTMVGAHRLQPAGDLSLDQCIEVAASMLRGEQLEAGEQSRQRDALLAGFNYLFVDEYQDIDASKYALLSAIAGRGMGGDQRKLRVFAVGDDDQAIFDWSGARTDFIRSFEEDYRATRFVVPHNYRNPKGILALAQALVEPLPGRLKEGQTLVVDPARYGETPGGPWADAHPELQGKVVWRRAGSVRLAAWELMTVVARWLEAGVPPERIGVLARWRGTGLHRLRIAAEARGVPFRWPLPGEASLPVSRVREVVELADFLEADAGYVTGRELEGFLDVLEPTPWVEALRVWLEPNLRQRRARRAWRHDLAVWARLERRARTVGAGVHLGTMHSAKGLEFDHVLLLDDGRMEDSPEERRLLYVALTRARRSLQLFSTSQPSPAFAALDGPILQARSAGADPEAAPSDHDYGFLGRTMVFLDWLGRRPADAPGHAAMERARPGDAFTLDPVGEWVLVRDADGIAVGTLSRTGREQWLPRVHEGLKLRLVALTREEAADPFRDAYRHKLRVDRWWTGVWEGRWRAR